MVKIFIMNLYSSYENRNYFFIHLINEGFIAYLQVDKMKADFSKKIGTFPIRGTSHNVHYLTFKTI